jgi:hypothetical protein
MCAFEIILMAQTTPVWLFVHSNTSPKEPLPRTRPRVYLVEISTVSLRLLKRRNWRTFFELGYLTPDTWAELEFFVISEAPAIGAIALNSIVVLFTFWLFMIEDDANSYFLTEGCDWCEETAELFLISKFPSSPL